MGEVLEIGVGERMERVGHGRVVGAPAVVFVLAQGFDQIFFTLTCETRCVVLTGKIWLVTKVATMLLDQDASFFGPVGIESVRAGFGRRELGDDRRGAAQIVVAPALHHPSHGLEVAHFFPEHQQLYGKKKYRLSAEGRYLRDNRLAVFAMAGEARGEPFADGRRVYRDRDE